MSKIKTITTCIVAVLLLLALSACGVTDLEGQSQAPQAIENKIVPSPNETGIYTTVAGFEHGDTGRQHVFDSAVFTGDLNNPRSNQINIRTTTDDYPGIYNVVTRNQDELFVYFGSYGDVEVSKGPALARIDANSLEEVWRISVADLTPQDWKQHFPILLSTWKAEILIRMGILICSSLFKITISSHLLIMAVGRSLRNHHL